MPKVKYRMGKRRTNLNGVTTFTPSRRTGRTPISIRLDEMTSAELIDVFAAIKAMEKGISHTPTTSVKASLITRKYRCSTPSARKIMLENISRTIVERNANENPATPEMIAKLKKTFG